MNARIAAVFLAGLAGLGPSSARSGEPGAGAIGALEAKWRAVMTQIRGWDAEGLRQFREGYGDYPPEVLQEALAARSFERMQDVLDAHAAARSQAAMLKALPRARAVNETLPDDASNPQLVEAKRLVAKALGDDARDLVFIPITPCTVWDTRFATNPDSAGIIAAAQTKRFYSHLDGAGGSFAAYGGNPSCPETAQNFIGFRPFAVMMTVYINDATAQGWLTLYRDGDPDPSQATISVYYSPGPTRTQTVISKSSRGYGTGAYDVAATSRFASTHASAAVTGYFVKVNEVGSVSSVTASAPLASTGGNTPNITLTGGATGTVMAGSGGVATWSSSPSISGNLNLSSPSGFFQGNITKLGNRFLHNYGTGNTFVGLNAGNFSMTGSFNTALGEGALDANTSGTGNTAIGTGALGTSTTGFNNIAIGSSAGQNIGTGANNITIGTGGQAADTGTTRIGSGQSRVFITGIRNITTGLTGAITVLIDGNGQLGTLSSSARVKDDVADMGDATARLMKLRPVTFQYKAYGPQGTRQYGLIAEEVEHVYPELVAHSADGRTETVMYHMLPSMLLNEYQKQQRTIEALREQVDRLTRSLEAAPR